ncbi:hypothetical protein ZIOFF_022025 [Zingiber officinale]|uniref:Cysteine proteinase inhibitor n=1 Tax=Zingiber officinale TaxID=94328 RepID=A0A8J5H0Z8_ZINOF|nr:hypothetical protein ZIOFF_022025 [Zingiber officinale]
MRGNPTLRFTQWLGSALRGNSGDLRERGNRRKKIRAGGRLTAGRCDCDAGRRSTWMTFSAAWLVKNALLEFARVVKAREQVVTGTLHHLTVEEVEGGEKKLYEPKVWVKTWLNFKQVEEFKHVGEQGKSDVNS